MLVTRQLTAPIEFHSMGKKNTMDVNGCHQLSGYRHYSKYLPLCSSEKETHTGLEQHEDDDDDE